MSVPISTKFNIGKQDDKFCVSVNQGWQITNEPSKVPVFQIALDSQHTLVVLLLEEVQPTSYSIQASVTVFKGASTLTSYTTPKIRRPYPTDSDKQTVHVMAWGDVGRYILEPIDNIVNG